MAFLAAFGFNALFVN